MTSSGWRIEWGDMRTTKVTEDQADGTYQAMVQRRFQNLATRASQAASYVRPEILSLSKKALDEYLAAKEMQPFRLVLERIIRFKPYTLRTAGRNPGDAGGDGRRPARHFGSYWMPT